MILAPNLGTMVWRLKLANGIQDHVLAEHNLYLDRGLQLSN